MIIDSIDYNDEKTWKLFHDGKTKGVFQLESNLGKSWSKKVKPSNIEELAALISVIRPGTLKAVLDGKSLTQHYVDRKNGTDKVTYLDPSLESILKNTYGILCIHEDTMISLNNGLEIPIKDVNVGYEVNSVNQNTLKCQKEICEDICKSPQKDGIKITLENGWSIIVTNDHKIYTIDGPKEAHRLDKSDYVQFVNRQTCPNPCFSNTSIPTNNYWPYLYGQLLGDGCSGECIASGKDSNHKKLLSFLKSEFKDELNIDEYFHHRSNYISISGKDLLKDKFIQYKEYGNRKTWYRYIIESLELDKTKNEKIISKEILMNSNEVRHKFLAGLFDADGYAGENKSKSAIRHYCSANIYVLHQIRKMLSIDGINTYLSNDEKHLYVINTKTFDEKIGKFCILKKLVGQTSSGKKVGSFPKQKLKSFIQNQSKSIKSYCTSKGLSENVLFSKSNATMETVNKLGYDIGDVYFMQIKSIEKISNQNFYSISISNTHNLIGNGFVIANCYQEQAMQIAQKLAGFSESEADVLRKAIGKKKADLMAKVKKDFVKGCEKVGIVTSETASEIFSWIEKSARYSFNKSHAVAYAINGYWSAYFKANYMEKFYTAWLNFSQEKQDPHQEVYELVSDAKSFNFEFQTPKITKYQKTFNSEKNTIHFGIKNIKSLTGINGEKVLVAIKELKEELNKNIEEVSWLEILIFLSTKINSTSFKTLCSIGFFRGISNKVTRNQALYEYEIFKILTKTELKWVTENYSTKKWATLKECFIDLAPTKKEGGGTSKVDRKQKILAEIQMIDSPPYSLEDDIDWIVEQETKLVGCPVSMSKIDNCISANCNSSCKEIDDGKIGKNLSIAVTLNQIKNHTINKDGPNKGKEMSFLIVEDNTGTLDGVVMFPDSREENKYSLFEGNTVIIQGSVDKKRIGSLVVEKMWEI